MTHHVRCLRTGTAIERIVRSKLIVVDDVEVLPASEHEPDALYRLVDAT